MKSWSQHMFLKINNQIGKNKWVDFFMIFCARWLIFILMALSFWFAYTFSPHEFGFFILVFFAAFVFMILFHWVLAILWHHPRPYVELPQIKQLVKPIQNYKSFPSDHTATSFLVVTLTVLALGFVWESVLLYTIALLVSFSRIYVGVHYPRDVIAGIFSGFLFSFLSFKIVIIFLFLFDRFI